MNAGKHHDTVPGVLRAETLEQLERIGELPPRAYMPAIGEKVIVTVDNWFYGPDGREYRAVFGTVHGIHSDQDTLGMKTNARSTNWYMNVGGAVIAGCQIHYVCRADKAPPETAPGWTLHDGNVVRHDRPSVVLDADAMAACGDSHG